MGMGSKTLKNIIGSGRSATRRWMVAETQKSATVIDVSVGQIFLCSCEVSGEVVQKAFAIN
jgi:hypothetical protein